MRLDRLLTLYFFHPLRRILWRDTGLRISILMYHSILEQDDPGRHPYFQTNTKPEIFSRHMQVLADNDYKVISLSEAISLLSIVSRPEAGSRKPEAGSFPRGPKPESGSPKPGAKRHQLPNQLNYSITSPRKYCVLTWDDAHRDYHDNAWPILKKYGYPATMFLPTGFVDNERKRLNGKECLTWDEVEEIASQGGMFGAHTVSHMQLYGMDSRKIDYEINQSKGEIEGRLHSRVEHYAYALAFPEQDMVFVRNLLNILHQAGFTGAVSTRIGTAKPGDNPYILKRIPVNSHDDERLLRAKLAGAYDWLNRIQAMKKRVKFAG